VALLREDFARSSLSRAELGAAREAAFGRLGNWLDLDLDIDAMNDEEVTGRGIYNTPPSEVLIYLIEAELDGIVIAASAFLSALVWGELD
jgi:hypothetical protein